MSHFFYQYNLHNYKLRLGLPNQSKAFTIESSSSISYYTYHRPPEGAGRRVDGTATLRGVELQPFNIQRPPLPSRMQLMR